MVRVAVGSTNKAKIEATRKVFAEYYPSVDILSLGVSSSVPSQPINNQTFEGAQYRAEQLRQMDKERAYDYYVGIEGGIISMHSHWFQVDTACIINKKGRIAFGISPSFEVPENIVERLKKGEELSSVLDDLLKQTNTRETGMIKYLTKGRVDKTAHLYIGVLMAFLQFENRELYGHA